MSARRQKRTWLFQGAARRSSGRGSRSRRAGSSARTASSRSRTTMARWSSRWFGWSIRTRRTSPCMRVAASSLARRRCWRCAQTTWPTVYFRSNALPLERRPVKVGNQRPAGADMQCTRLPRAPTVWPHGVRYYFYHGRSSESVGPASSHCACHRTLRTLAADHLLIVF